MCSSDLNMIHPLSAEKEIEFYLNASESTTAITLDQFYDKFEHVRQNTKIINIIIASVKDALSRTIRAGYMLTEGRKIQNIPEDAPVIRWREFMDMSRFCFYKSYRVERGFNDPAVILYLSLIHIYGDADVRPPQHRRVVDAVAHEGQLVPALLLRQQRFHPVSYTHLWWG